ncbi:MAG: hypothetical protein RLO81_15305 [Fulvivirga sp.]|uniref:hypothetical protein n=1 Tax=Fulvivirga sp. TaxID=1931237 RepID=UPI0032EE5BFD
MKWLFLLMSTSVLIYSCQNERKKSTSEISTTQCTPNKVFDCFISDSVWFETYRQINNKVTRPLIADAFKVVSQKTDIDNGNLGLLFFIATNLDSTGFNAPNFLLRYPFANQIYITGQFKKLAETGLLVYNNARFKISEKGRKVINDLTTAINSQKIMLLSTAEVELVLHLFHQVSNSENLKCFPSLVERRKALVHKNVTPTSTSLKFIVLMDDLIAMRNDASHYRMERLNKEINLSLPAAEILAHLGSGTFVYSDFSDRPTWGHSKEETTHFEEELTSLHLASRNNNGELKITELGQELQSKSALNAEMTFYEPWLNIDKETLKDYYSILNKLKS